MIQSQNQPGELTRKSLQSAGTSWSGHALYWICVVIRFSPPWMLSWTRQVIVRLRGFSSDMIA